MGRQRREFSPEYKDEAVSLVINTGRTVALVARELGINEATPGRWVNLQKDRQVGGDTPLSESEQVELARLRNEVAEPKLDRAFLKKASPLTAQDASDSGRPPRGQRDHLAQDRREDDADRSTFLTRSPSLHAAGSIPVTHPQVRQVMYPGFGKPGVHDLSGVSVAAHAATVHAGGGRTVGSVTRPEGPSTVRALPAPYPKRCSVEPHGRTWRARWVNDPAGPGPKRGGEPFASEDDARMFVALATRHGLPLALDVVRGGCGARLDHRPQPARVDRSASPTLPTCTASSGRRPLSAPGRTSAGCSAGTRSRTSATPTSPCSGGRLAHAGPP